MSEHVNMLYCMQETKGITVSRTSLFVMAEPRENGENVLRTKFSFSIDHIESPVPPPKVQHIESELKSKGCQSNLAKFQTF